jgi:hypothetical protein
MLFINFKPFSNEKSYSRLQETYSQASKAVD